MLMAMPLGGCHWSPTGSTGQDTEVGIVSRDSACPRKLTRSTCSGDKHSRQLGYKCVGIWWFTFFWLLCLLQDSPEKVFEETRELTEGLNASVSTLQLVLCRVHWLGCRKSMALLKSAYYTRHHNSSSTSVKWSLRSLTPAAGYLTLYQSFGLHPAQIAAVNRSWRRIQQLSWV